MELYLSRIILDPTSKAVMHDLGSPRELHKSISRCFPAIDGQEGKLQHERDTPRTVYRILHRLDQKGESVVLYVQSAIPPKWEKLLPAYAIRADVKPVHDLYAEIKNGDRLQFRLAANPTKRVPRSDEIADAKFKSVLPRDEYKKLHGKHETRRRTEILGDREPDANGVKKTREDKLIDWLNRKGEPVEHLIERAGNRERSQKVMVGGFRILSANVSDKVANVSSELRGKTQFKRERNDKKPVTLDAVVFDGLLEVTDAEAFRNALANGIGQGKAYGFGLLSVAPVR